MGQANLTTPVSLACAVISDWWLGIGSLGLTVWDWWFDVSGLESVVEIGSLQEPRGQ